MSSSQSISKTGGAGGLDSQVAAATNTSGDLERYIENPKGQFSNASLEFKVKKVKNAEKANKVFRHNLEGDLVVAGSSDSSITLFSTKDMSVLGVFKDANKTDQTYAVSDLDISFDSKLIISSHGDGTVRMWNLMYGTLIRIHRIPNAARLSGIAFADGSSEFSVLVDNFGSHPARLMVYHVKDRNAPVDISTIMSQRQIYEDQEPRQVGFDDRDKGYCIRYSLANEHIIVGSTEGRVYKFRAGEIGGRPEKKKYFEGEIKTMSFNKDYTMLVITGDRSCKIIDPVSLDVLRTWSFPQDHYCFSAALHPTHPFIIISTGPDKVKAAASKVPNEVKIYNTIFDEDDAIGKLHVNFTGVFNWIDTNPSGKSFVAAGVDGYCHMYEFPEAMLKSFSTKELIDQMETKGNL